MIAQEIIDKLKEQFGSDLRLLSSDAGDGVEVIVRKPNRQEWKRFRAESGDKTTRDVASENLFRSVVVYPDRPSVMALLERLPGIVEEFSEHLLELVGITTQSESKKL